SSFRRTIVKLSARVLATTAAPIPASILESNLFINIILLLLNHNGLGQNDDESAIDGLNIRATKVVPTILVVSPFGADACKVVVISNRNLAICSKRLEHGIQISHSIHTRREMQYSIFPI